MTATSKDADLRSNAATPEAHQQPDISRESVERALAAVLQGVPLKGLRGENLSPSDVTVTNAVVVIIQQSLGHEVSMQERLLVNTLSMATRNAIREKVAKLQVDAAARSSSNAIKNPSVPSRPEARTAPKEPSYNGIATWDELRTVVDQNKVKDLEGKSIVIEQIYQHFVSAITFGTLAANVPAYVEQKFPNLPPELSRCVKLLVLRTRKDIQSGTTGPSRRRLRTTATPSTPAAPTTVEGQSQVRRLEDSGPPLKYDYSQLGTLAEIVVALKDDRQPVAVKEYDNRGLALELVKFFNTQQQLPVGRQPADIQSFCNKKFIPIDHPARLAMARAYEAQVLVPRRQSQNESVQQGAELETAATFEQFIDRIRLHKDQLVPDLTNAQFGEIVTRLVAEYRDHLRSGTSIDSDYIVRKLQYSYSVTGEPITRLNPIFNRLANNDPTTQAARREGAAKPKVVAPAPDALATSLTTAPEVKTPASPGMTRIKKRYQGPLENKLTESVEVPSGLHLATEEYVNLIKVSERALIGFDSSQIELMGTQLPREYMKIVLTNPAWHKVAFHDGKAYLTFAQPYEEQRAQAKNIVMVLPPETLVKLFELLAIQPPAPPAGGKEAFTPPPKDMYQREFAVASVKKVSEVARDGSTVDMLLLSDGSQEVKVPATRVKEVFLGRNSELTLKYKTGDLLKQSVTITGKTFDSRNVNIDFQCRLDAVQLAELRRVLQLPDPTASKVEPVQPSRGTEILGRDGKDMRINHKLLTTAMGDRMVAGSDAGFKYADGHIEDRLLVSPDKNMFVVVDGMGGEGQGDKSAEDIAQAFATYPDNWHFAAQQASRTIHADPSREDKSGAAVVAGRIVEKSGQKYLEYAYSADCQVIVIDKNGTVKFVSKTQSWMETFQDKSCPKSDHKRRIKLLLDHGAINFGEGQLLYGAIDRSGCVTEEEAAFFPARNMVDGGVTGVESTLVQGKPVQLEKGDRVLAYSDGIGDNLLPTEIAKEIQGLPAEEAFVKLAEITEKRMKQAATIRSIMPIEVRAQVTKYPDEYKSTPKEDNRALVLIDVS